MARLNEEGQWIILMGIMVSIGIFFLAFIINQSTLVGQTTAEGVLEFPKNEIQDTRSEIFRWSESISYIPFSDTTKRQQEKDNALRDISTIARYRRNAEVWFNIDPEVDVGGNKYFPITIHYNNGVTEYNEAITYFVGP
jgi:hypothetical protein